MKASITLLLLLFVSLSHCQQQYKFGFMLNSNDNYVTAFESIINFAIDKFNNGTDKVELSSHINYYNGTNLYNMVSEACDMLTEDITLVLSPSDSNSIGVQADVFNKVNMPIIGTSATNSNLLKGSRDELFLLPPLDEMQAHVIVDILSKYGWMDLSIIASDSNYGINGVTYFQKLLVETTAEISVKEEFKTSVYFFNANEDPEKIDISDIITNVLDAMDRIFVLHCEDLYGKWVLKKAYEAGLMGETFVWIVTESITSAPQNLKIKLNDTDNSGYYPSYYDGLLGISLYVDTESNNYKSFKDEALIASGGQLKGEDIIPIVGMLYDAVTMAGKALEANLVPKNTVLSRNTGCGETPWEGSQHISDSIVGYNYEGATGTYLFLANGTTTMNAKYRIVNFKDPGTGAGSMFSSIGTWTADANPRLEITSSDLLFLGGVKQPPRGIPNSLNGRHMKIGAVHGPPFALNPTGCKENECWSGICPTIIKDISSNLNFTYEFVKPSDNKYGHYNETTKVWSGMVNDLLENRIDVIAMDLSVSSLRREYIDFTIPFLETGVSAIIKGESKTNTKFFFLSPFGFSTWAAILISFALISLFQTFVGKLSPYDNHGKLRFAESKCVCAKCTWGRQDSNIHTMTPEDLHMVGNLESCLVEEAAEECGENKTTVLNALWVVGGSLVGQGGEPLPRSPSGRVILLTWWFFVMLIVNMYAANLTAFMTLDKVGIPIKTPTDLLGQSEYGWGIRPRSSTNNFLTRHNNEEYRQLALEATPMESFDSSLRRVNEGGFALFDDYLWLENNISNNCDLFFIGEKLLAVPVAFGLPHNSPYASLLNKYILEYRERGYFKELWKEKGPAPRNCGNDNIGNDKTLNLDTLVGIFYILAVGLGTGVLFLLLELVCASLTDYRKKTTFCSRLYDRVTAVVGNSKQGNKTNHVVCNGKSKQVRIHRNEPGETESVNYIAAVIKSTSAKC